MSSSFATQRKHIICLLQPGEEVSRTYTEFDSLREAVEGLCAIYETNTKKAGEEQMDMDAYDVETVIEYFNSYDEIVFLVYDTLLNNYVPHDEEWVLNKLKTIMTSEADE